MTVLSPEQIQALANMERHERIVAGAEAKWQREQGRLFTGTAPTRDMAARREVLIRRYQDEILPSIAGSKAGNSGVYSATLRWLRSKYREHGPQKDSKVFAFLEEVQAHRDEEEQERKRLGDKAGMWSASYRRGK